MWDYLEDTEEGMSIDTLVVTNNLRCVGLLGRYRRMHEYQHFSCDKQSQMCGITLKIQKNA